MIETKDKKGIVPVKVEQKGTSKEGVLKETNNGMPNGKPMSEVLAELKPPTAESRKRNAEQFAMLSQKHNLLVEKKSSLDKFLIGDDGLVGSVLIIKSGTKSFDVSNNAVIKELLVFAKEKLNSLILVAEAEILSFVI